MFETRTVTGQLPPHVTACTLSAHGEGYDGGSSDSECESPTLDEQESQSPLMPEFWLIVKIHQDRVKVYSHCRLDISQITRLKPLKPVPEDSSCFVCSDCICTSYIS